MGGSWIPVDWGGRCSPGAIDPLGLATALFFVCSAAIHYQLTERVHSGPARERGGKPMSTSKVIRVSTAVLRTIAAVGADVLAGLVAPGEHRSRVPLRARTGE